MASPAPDFSDKILLSNVIGLRINSLNNDVCKLIDEKYGNDDFSKKKICKLIRIVEESCDSLLFSFEICLEKYV